MNILFTTYSSPEDNSANCDCAVVELTPSLARKIRRRVEIVRRMLAEDEDTLKVYFWDAAAEFYGYELVESGAEAADDAEAWEEALKHDGHVRLPDGVALAAHQSRRVECSQMRVDCPATPYGRDLCIAWLTIPKHTDIYVTTSELSLGDLERYARYAAAGEPFLQNAWKLSARSEERRQQFPSVVVKR